MARSPRRPDELSPSNLRLRLGIALLGAALPPVLFFFGLLFGKPLPTLSDYYHCPPAGSFFVGILWATGVFLILYQGFSSVPDSYRMLPNAFSRHLTDANLTTLAGFAMILTAVIPTDKICTSGQFWSFTTLHFASAFVCFVTLAVISLWSFTASAHAPQDQSPFRIRSNRIFRLCGLLILAAIAAIGAFTAFGPECSSGQTVFWLESVAVWAFAFSWLRKAMPDPADTAPRQRKKA